MTQPRYLEFSTGFGPGTQSERAYRATASAPPWIRAKVLRHHGMIAEADEIERRHMEPADYAELQNERATAKAANEGDDDLKIRLRLAALTV
jgi:hypothetical protein